MEPGAVHTKRLILVNTLMLWIRKRGSMLKKSRGLQVAVLKGRVRGCIMCNQSSVGNIRLFSTRILFLLLLLFSLSLTHTLSFFPSLLGSVTIAMALFIGRIPKTMSTVCQQLHASIRLN